MSNYYYILSSAKIYVKHFKRLKCYKTVKKCRNRENGFSPKEGNLRILSRIANRSTYRDLLQETKKKKKKYRSFQGQEQGKGDTYPWNQCE